MVTDGGVTAMEKSGQTLYLGGLFTTVGVRTGGGRCRSRRTPAWLKSIYPSVNGDVLTVANDGQGGWYIGGTFTLVGGILRTNLAHIRSDRTVDPAWSPVIANGSVDSLWLTGARFTLAAPSRTSTDHLRAQSRRRRRQEHRNSHRLEPERW